MASEFRKLSFQYVRHERAESLLAFLLRRFRYHSAAEWTALIQSGAVTVNSHQAPPEHVLLSRERIVYVPPPKPEPPVDARYTLLYEDASVLAVSKSANIPTSPSGKYWHNCLRHVLQRDLQISELHAVHRLDRETSGVNLFAKTRRAAAVLGQAFAAGTVEKRYAAVLRGSLPCRDTLVSAPLRDAEGEVHIKQGVHPQGKPSVTRFILRARLPGASLVDVLPTTGRTHQIRAHAAFLGLPVWGDRLYGVPAADFLAWLHDPNRDLTSSHLLHSKCLVFVHPESGERVVVGSDEGRLVREWVGKSG